MPREAKLNFYFTEEDFYPDVKNSDDCDLLHEYEKDRFHTLYKRGFGPKPRKSASEDYLWRIFRSFLNNLTSIPGLELERENAQVEIPEAEMDQLILSVPFVIGFENVNEDWINNIIQKLQEIYTSEIKDYNGTVKLYLEEKNQNLRVPERVFFHLVENKDDLYPFAFLATYATKDKNGRTKHVPLSYALKEYQGENEKLIHLLTELDQAADISPLIAQFMESGELFHGIKLTAEEAYAFLKDVEEIEKAGIICRIPNWWRQHTHTVSLSLKIGDKQKGDLGFDSILSLRPELEVDGVVLTKEDIQKLLEETNGLSFLKGKWIEVDHEKLQQLLSEMEGYPHEITLLDALRMQMKDDDQEDHKVPSITNGSWLSHFMKSMRRPQAIPEVVPPKTFHATLRPYQKVGTTWLSYMDALGFGACLADDMGLGKTIEVLGYLENMRKDEPNARVLLIAPASLLGNWQKEAERFAPEMSVLILHGKTAKKLDEEFNKQNAFLTITTYQMAARLSCLQDRKWRCLILDEAQAIKNPRTKQTRSIKEIQAKMRISMTGTPVENDLSNLWSQFDFLDQGLLGTLTEFKTFVKNLSDHNGYLKLKNMISPFMLRRVKTDKSIISDLPERIERKSFITLSNKQKVLYRKYVGELEQRLIEAEQDGSDIKKKGLILGSLIKLKQICNHPDQYLGEETFAPEESGKFLMLKEICTKIYEKRERVLVFTQFKEMTEPLADYLEEVFGIRGYVIDGSTPIKKRNAIVEKFQSDAYIPYLVISVKAGGTGLNLTKANHVIHFDRWWNPAVEDQATDRAFRIGQKKNVLVHKFVCANTIEEKIDELIEAKKNLQDEIIGTTGENWITNLSDDQLLDLLKLDDQGGRA